MKNSKILLVDDERIVLTGLAQQIKEGIGNFSIEVAENAEEAIEVCEEIKENQQEIALIISDQLMPGMKGDELLIRLHQMFPDAIKILLTGQASMDAVQNAINHANLYRFLSKPWNKTDLVMSVKEALHLYENNQKLKENNILLDSLYQNTQKLQTIHKTHDLFKLAERITFQEIDLNFQSFIDLKNNQVIHSKGISDYENEKLLTWLPSQINFLSPSTFHHLKNKNFEIPLKNTTETVIIQLSENIFWIISSESPFKNFAFNWLRLFSENLKIQLQKCFLFENLENQVEQRTHEVKMQAQVIQQQHEDILHSLKYARRIQEAILPKMNIQNCPLKYHYLYQPKDIVSGDFYWYKNLGDIILFALGDCTGHGVPGAMLSTLSISLLNQLITDYSKKWFKVNTIDNNNYQPLEINDFLNLFAMNFSESLNRTLDHHAKDGLEIGIFAFDLSTSTLQFAGANMDLWIIRNQNIIELEGCKQSIEGWNFNFQTYKNNVFSCEPNDFLVLFTDGVADQFGGEQNRKFGYKKLREFFLQYFKPKSSPDQLDWLTQQLREWQGNNEQTDDRLCFVFKV